MKAVRIVEPYNVELCDVPEPAVGPEDVLIRVRALGLCGSDLTTYRGLNPMVGYPRIAGHEIAGEIADKGAAVPAEFAIGSAVTISPYTACGKCPACRLGRENCCRDNQTMGVQRDGAATEYVAVPFAKVFRVDAVSYEHIACIEPLSVGRHATERGAVTSGEKVLVFGCGVIGLGAVAAASYKGAEIIAVDIDNNKLQKALSLGATHTINSARKSLRETVAEITSGDGPAVVIEAVGLPETFTGAVELVAFAGRVVYIGYTKKKVEYDTKLFVSKELDIRGSRNAFNDDISAVINMLAAGKVDVEPLITHRYRLDEAAQALDFWDRHTAEVTKILLLI